MRQESLLPSVRLVRIPNVARRSSIGTIPENGRLRLQVVRRIEERRKWSKHDRSGEPRLGVRLSLLQQTRRPVTAGSILQQQHLSYQDMASNSNITSQELHDYKKAFEVFVSLGMPRNIQAALNPAWQDKDGDGMMMRTARRKLPNSRI